VIEEIPVADIQVPHDRECRGDLERLKASIGEIGLLHPITVRESTVFGPGGGRDGYLLIAGRNRLQAFIELERPTIPAQVMSLENVRNQLAEIDENLCRTALPTLNQCDDERNRKIIWLNLHPETAHGGDRKSQEYKEENQKGDSPTRYTTIAAEARGAEETAIKRRIKIAEDIGEDVKDKIRGSQLADSLTDLLSLSRINGVAEQHKAVDRVLSGKADKITTRKKHARKPTKSEREEAAESLAKILIALPEDLWPEIDRCLKLDEAKKTRTAFRKLTAQKTDLRVIDGGRS
jgi:ParB family chromosome partitioning protein